MTTSREIIQASVAAHNRRAEHTARDMEPIARFVVGTVLAVLAVCALLHWATPCDGSALCMGFATVPSRRRMATAWAQRLLARLRAAYLRMWIRCAKDELADMFDEQVELAQRAWVLPQQMEQHRQWIAARQLDLASAELDARAQ